MRKKRLSGRRLRHVPQRVKGQRIWSRDWSRGLCACEHCGEPTDYPGYTWNDVVCPGCGKKASSHSVWWNLLFLVYLIAVLILGFVLRPGEEDAKTFALSFAGGFILLAGLYFVWAFLISRRILDRKIKKKMIALKQRYEQAPEDMEILCKMAALYWVLRDRQESLTLFEKALTLDPDNSHLKAQVESAREFIHIFGSENSEEGREESQQ